MKLNLIASYKNINIGFSGTQEGMSHEQLKQFFLLMQLFSPKVIEFHHGSCIGSDTEAHCLVNDHFPHIEIYIHPCDINSKRVSLSGHWVYNPKPPLVRNRIIVDQTDILIATPKEDEEVLRSGTWSTIRYARKKEKSVIIVSPGGDLHFSRTVYNR